MSFFIFFSVILPLISLAVYWHSWKSKSSSKTSIDLNAVGAQKVKSLKNGEVKELRSFWKDQNAAIIFFRRWGCIACRLWATELKEIAPVLAKHNIKLVGVGVEKYNSEEFLERKFFAGVRYHFQCWLDRFYYRKVIISLTLQISEIGALYYVKNLSLYQELGFKRFNRISILISLLWKQTREAITIGRRMGLGGDIRGDGVQTGGALLVGKGGKVLHHFTQTGPAEHMSNYDILKTFGLEHEYKPEMANKKIEDREVCNLFKNSFGGAAVRWSHFKAKAAPEVPGSGLNTCT
ncbi:hypothetical protein ABMA27_010170 [Loxostege sticticalis]|uniref:Prostamide/prostaglandin F synthase n=1 Tax=Loxostege sticticalis TaxID=481309 RepID=A0ABR3H5I9_LOXSC